jgi:glycosyltransferase 2 family protein
MAFLLANWKKGVNFIGLGICVFLIWKVDASKLLEVMGSANRNFLFYLPITFFSIMIVQTLRWASILRCQKIKVPFKTIFLINWVGLFYSTITPGRVGNLIKMSYLKDSTGLSLAKSSSGVIVEKIIDIFTLFLFSLGGAYFLLEKSKHVFLVILGAVCVIAFVVVVFHDIKVMKKLYSIIPETFRTNYMFDRVASAMKEFWISLPRKRNLVLPMFFSLLAWGLIFSQLYIVARSVGINVEYLKFIFLVSLGSVSGLLPISISGLGTREAVLIPIFALFNVEAVRVMSMTFLSLILCTYLPSFVGWVISLKITGSPKIKV